MKQILCGFLAAAALLAGAFCASPSSRPVRRAGSPSPAAVALSTDSLDPASEKLGREMAARLFARDPLSPDGRLLRYVNLVGRTAAGAAVASRYRFAVTQSDVPYSIALPGRFVVLSRGMLFLMSSEADLAVGLSREVCRAQQPGELGEPTGESTDPALESRLDLCGARLASAAGYDVSGFLHVVEALRDRAVSARDVSDFQARLDSFKAIPEFSRGGKTLADRFRSSAIL